MINILLAITSNTGRETYLIPFAHSLINNTMAVPVGYNIEVHVFGGLSIDLVRTSAAQFAIKHKFDAVVFFDDDMILPPKALITLIKHWEKSQIPIVSGVYTSKSFPFHSFIYPLGAENWLQEYDNTKRYEVKTIATGCVLIDTNVFRTLPKPWFLLRRDLNGYLTATEDCYFGNKCFQAGIKMYVDASIECQHLRLVAFPAYYDHPNYHYDGEWRAKKAPSDNLPESRGPIIIHPLEGSHINDGLDKCCHIHQYPVPVNEGEDALWRCLDCGLVSTGQQLSGLNVVNKYHCTPENMKVLIDDLSKET